MDKKIFREFIDQNCHQVPKITAGKYRKISEEMRESSLRTVGLPRLAFCDICRQQVLSPVYWVDIPKNQMRCAQIPRKCPLSGRDRTRPYK